MKERPATNEPLSALLRRHPDGTRLEIVNTIRWVGLVAIAIFLSLIISSLILHENINAIIMGIGLIPLTAAMILLKRGGISLPSTILAVTIVLLITWLATRGYGLHDVGILGFPVVLIVAGLILRGRVILYLSILILLCMTWLSLGASFGLYKPVPVISLNLEDFLVSVVIILVTGNAVYRLVKNVYFSFEKAEEEIANRKQVEAERNVIIQQLKRKNQELDRFALRVSHDLKSPLITMAGFLGYLEKDIKDGKYERAERNFDQINDAAKTMGKFVDELLDLSRIGRITTPPANVPFDEILDDALKVMHGPLKERQVQVEIDAQFPIVHVDQARIVQVLQNLLSNAVKFMGEQKHPHIGIGMESGSADIFFVTDNGIGIAPEHQDLVFELFNKVDPNTDGIGLGLGLVKKIIEVHGGRVWIASSSINKGTTIKFTLPLAMGATG